MGASPINAGDQLVMRGVPYLMRLMIGLRSPKSRGLGQDVAGTIEEVGVGVTDWVVGDEVLFERGGLRILLLGQLRLSPVAHMRAPGDSSRARRLGGVPRDRRPALRGRVGSGLGGNALGIIPSSGARRARIGR